MATKRKPTKKQLEALKKGREKRLRNSKKRTTTKSLNGVKTKSISSISKMSADELGQFCWQNGLVDYELLGRVLVDFTPKTALKKAYIKILKESDKKLVNEKLKHWR